MTIRIFRTFRHEPLLVISKGGITDRQGFTEHFAWSEIKEARLVVVNWDRSAEPMMPVPTLRLKTDKPVRALNKYLGVPLTRKRGYRYVPLLGLVVDSKELIRVVEQHADSSVQVEKESLKVWF